MNENFNGSVENEVSTGTTEAQTDPPSYSLKTIEGTDHYLQIVNGLIRASGEPLYTKRNSDLSMLVYDLTSQKLALERIKTGAERIQSKIEKLGISSNLTDQVTKDSRTGDIVRATSGEDTNEKDTSTASNVGSASDINEKIDVVQITETATAPSPLTTQEGIREKCAELELLFKDTDRYPYRSDARNKMLEKKLPLSQLLDAQMYDWKLLEERRTSPYSSPEERAKNVAFFEEELSKRLKLIEAVLGGEDVKEKQKKQEQSRQKEVLDLIESQTPLRFDARNHQTGLPEPLSNSGYTSVVFTADAPFGYGDIQTHGENGQTKKVVVKMAKLSDGDSVKTASENQRLLQVFNDANRKEQQILKSLRDKQQQLYPDSPNLVPDSIGVQAKTDFVLVMEMMPEANVFSTSWTNGLITEDQALDALVQHFRLIKTAHDIDVSFPDTKEPDYYYFPDEKRYVRLDWNAIKPASESGHSDLGIGLDELFLNTDNFIRNSGGTNCFSPERRRKLDLLMSAIRSNRNISDDAVLDGLEHLDERSEDAIKALAV